MSRAAKIEAAAREILASGGYGMPVGTWERLVAALALPADPVSVDARERALVEVGKYDARFVPDVEREAEIDRCIRLVSATHPRAPSVEYERGREDAARVCEERAVAATGQCRPDAHARALTNCDVIYCAAVREELQRTAARIRAHAPVAQVAPSADECPRCGGEAGEAHLCAGVHYRERFAPSAPRDQGGGLREWGGLRALVAAQKAAWVAAELADDGRDVARARVLEEEAADLDDEVSAWTLAHAELFALAAPVSEKERAK